jgi:hypothetical protein
MSSERRVGYIGTALDAYWAHLAQVRIIAEVPDSERTSFVQASPQQKREVMRKFHDLGGIAVLTKFPDVARSGENWQPISGTRYFVWRLAPNTSPEDEERPN